MAQLMDRRVGALGAFVLLAGVLLCAPNQVQAQPQSLYELISSNADLLLLKEALDVAGLNGTLQDPALTYTAFAPTNDAFFSILAEMQTTPEALLTLGPDAAPFLLYHVLPAALNSTDIPEGATSVPTLIPGANLTVVRQGASIVVNGLGSSANVTVADNYANSSVAHIVDNVLLPFFLSITSAAERTPDLSTLATALATVGRADTFRNPTLTYTVFAPTNEAFTRTLAYLGISDINLLLADTDALWKVLQYHVLPTPVPSAAITENATTVTTLGGAPVTVLKENGAVVVQTVGGVTANVLAADLPVGLGPRSLVHLVDAALVPWYPTIAAAVANNTNLSNFVAAVNAEGSYVSVVDGSTPFIGTIFAPTNAAFDVALSGLGLTLDELLANQALLKSILNTHIIPDQYIPFSDLTDGRTLPTLNNETLTVARNPGGAIVASAGSGASVDRDELNINNGGVAVYVVETVLLPSALAGGSSPTPAPEPAPAPASGSAYIYDVISSNANLTTFKTAIDAAGLKNTIETDTLTWTVFAPTDDAFAAALAAIQMSVTDLLGLPVSDLRTLLMFHMVPNAITAANVPEVDTVLSTLAHNVGAASLVDPSSLDLTVRRTGSAVTITSLGSTANVVTADVRAGAGVVHVVDTVLLPFYTTLAQAVTSRTDLSVLVAALTAANLTSVFSNPNLTYTLFAPTNAGFDRTLEALNMTAAQLLADVPTLTRVLQYHVLPTRVLSSSINDTAARVDTLSGDRVTVVRQNFSVVIRAPNVNSSVTTADIPVGVGIKSVVHVINAAMVPWYPSLAAAVTANPLFASLAAAIAAEGTLSNVVSGAVPFSGTILAPNNNAFATLLLSLGITSGLPTPAVLRPILLTHVVNGTVLSTATAANGTLTTLGGQTLTVTRTASGEVRIRGPGNSGNGALVVGRETRIGNVASILELDTVLLPAAPAPAPPSPPPPSPGAAASAVPSLGLLATSALAALALGLFGRLQ